MALHARKDADAIFWIPGPKETDNTCGYQSIIMCSGTITIRSGAISFTSILSSVSGLDVCKAYGIMQTLHHCN